jgi:hypothetical protein
MKHIAIAFFVSDVSYICAWDLETGSLWWKQPTAWKTLAETFDGAVLEGRGVDRGQIDGVVEGRLGDR